MPILKSAKKRMRQNAVRRAQNFPLRSELKTLYKKVLVLVKDGKLEEAAKVLPLAFSVIDTACKKNIIHPNNAARKKSRMALALNSGGEAGKAEVKPAKKAPKAAEKVEEEAAA